MARELKALLSQLEEWQIARPEAALLGTRQRREARNEVEHLQLVVEGKEGAAKAHHYAL